MFPATREENIHLKRIMTLGILVILAGLIYFPASTVRAQDDESANPWIAKSEADAQPDAKKEIPILSTYYAGDIEFIDEPIDANMNVDQVGGKLSGTWTLGGEDEGSFTGTVSNKGKVTFSLSFETSGPKCKIKLSGALTDGINIMTGTARLHNCGKSGKHLGKGSFDLQDG